MRFGFGRAQLTVIVLVGVLVIPLRSRAGLLETLSAGAYYLSLESCESVDEAAATEAIAGLERNCQCASKEDSVTPLRKITDFVFGSSSKLEDRFFEILGNEHGKDLRCMARKVEEAAANDDIQKKLPLLRTLRQNMQEALKEVARPDVVGKVCPLSLEDLRRDHNPDTNASFFNACQKTIQSRIAYEAVIRSIPGSELPDFRRFLDKESLANGANREVSRRVGLAASQASTQLRELAQNYRLPEDRALRVHLMADPGLVQRVVEGSSDTKSMRALACQADARFGKGATRLDLGLTVGSLALTGGAALTARAGSLAHKILHGTTAARAQGLVSARTAKVLQVSAFAMDSVSAYSGIESECLGGRSASQLKLAESKCSEDSRAAELVETNCVLAKTLAALQFGVLGATLFPGASSKKPTATPSVGLSQHPSASPSTASAEVVSSTTKPIKSNERMAAEVKLRQTAKSWPDRARQLARETIARRISELEMQFPSALRRRPPDADLIAEAEQELLEKLKDAKVIRTRDLERKVDGYINAKIVKALIDLKKAEEYLNEDALAYLSRSADFKARAQLDRHLEQIRNSRKLVDDAISEWLESGADNWDDLVRKSRAEAESTLAYHQLNRNEKAIELATERHWRRKQQREWDEWPIEMRKKWQRFQSGTPLDSEKSDYEIWNLLGKPDGDIDWLIGRYREHLGSFPNHRGRRDKEFAEALVNDGVIKRDSRAYREIAFGKGATRERLPPQPNVGQSQIEIPTEVRATCPIECPPAMRMRLDAHYDDHIWERTKDFSSRRSSLEGEVARLDELAKMGSDLKTDQIESLNETKRFLEDIVKNVARKGPTDLWAVSKRNWFLENLKNIKWGPPEISDKSKNHLLFKAEYNGTRVTMAVCVREPCSPPHVKAGEILSIYPQCGPGVYKVPAISKVQRSLEALNQATVNNDKKFREGLVVEKPCK